MCSYLTIFLLVALFSSSSAFFAPAKKVPTTRANGVKSLTAVLDVLAGISLANQMNNAQINPNFLTGTSMPVAVAETKMGMYREYTVDKIDDSALDSIKRSYKTAEETDDSKTKYWTILAVLTAGSFIIPMVQYYWYVAEED